MAKILITGGEGALARSLCERVAMGRVSLEPAFPGPVEVVPLSIREVDVTQAHAVEAAVERHRPDLLLYAAGGADLRRWEAYRWLAYLVHRDGADHAARACAKVGALMVYLSTDLVFDGLRETPYREEDPPNPSNNFAEMKLAGELRVMTHLTRHLIVRTGWLYGPSHRTIVDEVLARADGREPVTASDSAMRQPIYVEDFLDGLLRLLALGKTGTYHLAPAEGAYEFDVAEEVALSLGANLEVIPSRSSVAGLVPPYTVLDCLKAAEEGVVLPPWRQSLGKFLARIRGTRG